MTGYTRQSIFIAGDVIKAEHGNDEFNQLQSAFSNSTGHSHDGTAAEGAYVPLISDSTNTDKVEIVSGGAKTTGDHQITGTLTVDGDITASGTNTFDSLGVTNDIIVGGTVDGRDVATDGTKLDGIEAGATADQNASEVPFTPAGDIAATDVQAAIEELDTEKLVATHEGSGGSVHPVATTSVDGFLSASDKTKLDALSPQTSSGITDASLLPSDPFDDVTASNVQDAMEQIKDILESRAYFFSVTL